MTDDDIQLLIQQKGFPSPTKAVFFQETHISWILLTDQYAYKIKKPLKYSFLDFSTLDQRKHFCQEELKLNRRLAPDVYLQVLPIYKNGHHLYIGESKGELIDYTLQMRKLDNERLMSKLLKEGAVAPKDMKELALILADFHQRAERCTKALNIEEQWQDFADILSLKSVLSKVIGSDFENILQEAVDFSQKFLRQHQNRLQERYDAGYCVDGHGDLHSGNIFLIEKPIIFDCIEFDEHLRKEDLLAEIGFLCMDLEYHGQANLANHFLEAYLHQYACIENEEDQKILLYYKMYRANVRMKVSALPLEEKSTEEVSEAVIQSLQTYARLFQKYYQQLANARLR